MNFAEAKRQALIAKRIALNNGQPEIVKAIHQLIEASEQKIAELEGVRSEALEEAAKVAEDMGRTKGYACGIAVSNEIRQLKTNDNPK